MKLDPMAKVTGLFQRGTVWWLRVMIPLELQAAHKGSTKVVKSLGTTDRKEAADRAALLRAELIQGFKDLRRALNPRPVAQLTPELGSTLATGIRARLLQWDDQLRANPATAESWISFCSAFDAANLSKLRMGPPEPLVGPSAAQLEALAKRSPLDGLAPDQVRRLAEANQAWDESAGGQLAARSLSHIAPLAAAEALRLGLLVDWRSPEAQPILLDCLRAYRTAMADMVRRDQGADIDTPPVPSSGAPSAPVRLRDVFDKWKASKVRGKDSVSACERALLAFEHQSGNPPVVKITRAMGADLRAWLLTQELSSKTAHDRLTWIKSLLRFAYRDLELLSRQPWEGFDIEHTTTKPRHPWTPEQLKAFFSQPLFTRYELPTLADAAADAAYWIPLLGLYTGARVGELAQLRAVDVLADSAGPILRITEEAKDSTLKTAASRRDVPIHSELVRLGFLDYVEALRKRSEQSLWPSMRFRKGKPGANFSDWFNKARRSVPGGQVPDFHSLRHTVRTMLAEAGVEEKTKNRITGHAESGSTGSKVYEHVSAIALRQGLEKLPGPGVLLPRVFASPQSA